jgi:hypothetical protein
MPEMVSRRAEDLTNRLAVSDAVALSAVVALRGGPDALARVKVVLRESSHRLRSQVKEVVPMLEKLLLEVAWFVSESVARARRLAPRRLFP